MIAFLSIQEKQNGVLGVTTVPFNDQATCQAYLEPETPINMRTLTKATTPPVTIKNFFKPKAAEDSVHCNGNSSDKEIEICSQVVQKQCNQGVLEKKDDYTYSKGDVSNGVASKKPNKEVKSVYFQTAGLKNEGLSRSGDTADRVTGDLGLTSGLPGFLSTRSQRGKASLKRTYSSQCLKTNKRQKQASILSSFVRRTDKDVENAQKKETCCPICGLRFANHTRNAEMNKHIDECLVASS